MKKLIIAAAALMVSIAAYGQGQFSFNNHVVPDVTARFVLSSDTGTTSSVGTNYSVALFDKSSGGTLTALNPATTTFRGAAGTATAGYVTPTTETDPAVAAGSSASIVVRVLGPNGLSQDFGPYTVSLGGGTITPPNLPLGTSALVVNASTVPEPTTLALGLLGLGALLAIRRRS